MPATTTKMPPIIATDSQPAVRHAVWERPHKDSTESRSHLLSVPHLGSTCTRTCSIRYDSGPRLTGTATLHRPLFALTLAVALIMYAATTKAQDLIASRYRDYLEALRVQAGIPGLAAAIVGSNDILWEEAFGLQDVEQSVAVRTDTPFELDGVTQIFTTALVLRCVEEGHLSLEDPVSKFVSGSP